MIKWLKEKCPVCGLTFEYPEGGYKPKTCASFDCVQKFNHHPERYIPFRQYVDKCRMEAGI